MYCNTCQDILYLTDPPPRPQLKTNKRGLLCYSV